MEHPRLSGTPFAMLAAQCNELAKPPPADAAVGKFFQPWKEGAPKSPASQKSTVSLSAPQPPSHLGTPHQRPVTSSACGSPGAYGAENLFYFPPPMNAPVKTEVAYSSAPPWWDVGGPATAKSWLDISGGAPTVHNSSSDYSHLQHLHLQNTSKSMLPGQSRGAPFDSLVGPPPPELPLTRSKRGYSKRTTCDCPNCAEVKRLRAAGAHIRKKNAHSCHIPGCGKVYGMSYGLTVHLHTLRLQVVALRKKVHVLKQPATSPAHPHRRKTVRMSHLW